jgi:Co/Zn/Cd efflux system component
MQAGVGLAGEITRRLEADGADRIADLHIWRVGPGHNAAVVSLVSARPEAPAVYKARLASVASLSHVTIEVQHCPGAH